MIINCVLRDGPRDGELFALDNHSDQVFRIEDEWQHCWALEKKQEFSSRAVYRYVGKRLNPYEQKEEE